MDDLELLRGLGRELEHEPPGSLVRQRGRLEDAPRRRGRGHRPPGRWPLLGAVAAVTAALVLVPAALLHAGDPRVGRTAHPFAPGSEKPLNVLLLGSDTRAEGGRSDTIVLLHLPADRKGARVVSVPRDLLVRIKACKTPKGTLTLSREVPINAAFALGGADCARETVESVTSVEVDTTVVIDFAGFRGMVDALGGVEVTLPEPIRDPKSGTALLPGRQRLDGRRALAYVRVRYGVGDGSDLSRIGRQQRFLAAMARRAKAVQAGSPLRFAKFVAIASGSVSTRPRMDVGAMEALFRSLGRTEPDAVAFNTLPVRMAASDPNRITIDAAGAQRLLTPFRED